MKAKAEILKYAEQYMANRKYQRGYEKAKDQDAYFRSHETQIILLGGAENMLKRFGVKAASLDVEKMQAQERFERLIEGMKQAQGITEQLKEVNALEWTGRQG